MGLSQASVLSVFHPDAEEFYNVNNNLEKVGAGRCKLTTVKIFKFVGMKFRGSTPLDMFLDT